MHRSARTIGVVVLVVGVMLTALPVCAQARRPARPFRTLFGNVDANRPSLHSMDLTVSLNGAADDGLASPVSADGAPPSRFQGLYSAAARLNYVLRGRRLAGDAAGSVNLPYYAGSGDRLSALGYGANANLSYTSGPTTASTSGSYTYSPYYSMALDPAAAPGASAQPFDSASARNPNHTSSAGATLTRRLGRRTSASLAYAFNESSLEIQHLTVRSQDARIAADRQMSRRLTLRVSYAYREARFGVDAAHATDRSHDADVGVGYTRESPRGQATTIDLTLGSSVVRRDAPALHAGWRGSARVSRTFAPGWTAAAGFNRSLQFNTVLQTPIWADVANADVSGRFGRTVNLSLAATYSNGQRENLRERGFQIYSGSVRAQVGLAAFVAIDAQYIYYRYDFPTSYQLPAGVPLQMNRQRLQIGASFWLPLVRAGAGRERGVTVNQ